MFVALALLLACAREPAGSDASSGASGSGSSGSSGSSGAGSSSTTGQPDPTTSTSATTAASATGEGSSSTTDATTGEPAEPDPWTERRGILHVHSPYSHDACDGLGLIDGVPNAGCMADLRAAICAAGLDFALLTDHPAHMQEHPFETVLLHDPDAGDELVSEGDATYNLLDCGNGRRVVIAAGYESTHTMPLGLHHHVDAALYAGLTDGLPLADAKALIEGLAAGGAVTAIAHSEEEDLSAARIVEVGLDAMEWYNPHGNFKTALGGDNIAGDAVKVLGLLQGILPFMAGSTSGAHPDLVYLRLLPDWPVAGFEKWREVQRARAVTGVLGSDVHQNVAVDPICDNPNPVLQAACVAAAEAVLPESLAGLITGGTVMMADGGRLDSFARVLRWLENRVLTPPGALNLAALQDALRAGRSYGLFSVFGAPEGLRFAARDASDALLWIGDAAPGPLTLELRAPTRPAALAGGAPFTAAQADQADVRLELWRTDAEGTALVHELAGLGAADELLVTEPGAYHVEVKLRPRHLLEALGDQVDLAEVEYLWLITNPIRVTP